MRQLYLPLRVWDLPVRLFHWTLVILIFVSWLTQELGRMDLHKLCGYTIMALLLFRLAWGFVGSDTARFSKFLRSPLAAFRHLGQLHRREPDTEIGHNAAGGWMVLVMLLLLAVQVGAGLCASTDDDYMVNGPLAKYVGKAWSDQLSRVHAFNFYLILAVIVLHLLAITAYAVFKKQNLLRPMITGKKRLPGATRAPRLASPLRAIVVFAAAAGIATAVANLP
jgi:cytochrome b